MLFIDRGGNQYKRPYEHVLQTCVAKSASWHINYPYFMQNLVYEWVDNLKGKKELFWSKLGTKIRQIGIQMAHFFFENLYNVWVCFQIPSSTSVSKPIGILQMM